MGFDSQLQPIDPTFKLNISQSDTFALSGLTYQISHWYVIYNWSIETQWLFSSHVRVCLGIFFPSLSNNQLHNNGWSGVIFERMEQLREQIILPS